MPVFLSSFSAGNFAVRCGFLVVEKSSARTISVVIMFIWIPNYWTSDCSYVSFCFVSYCCILELMSSSGKWVILHNTFGVLFQPL